MIFIFFYIINQINFKAMKRQIFSIMALLLLVATVLTMSSCKKDTLTIKKQGLLLDGEDENMVDISCTKEGYIIMAELSEETAKKHNLPKDTYFINSSYEIIEIKSTSKTSGVVKIKGEKGEIEDLSYRNLTNKVVIFSAPNEKAGKTTISSMGAEAFESKIPLQEYPTKD